MPTVCVVGGGIGGLATAAALIHVAGYDDVCILEKRKCNKSSAAVQLGPNGLRALRAIGGEKFLEEVLHHGSTLEGNIVYPPPAPLGGSPTQNYFYASRTNTDNISQDNLPELMIRWDVLQSLLGTLLPPSVQVQSQVGQDIAGYHLLAGTSQEDDKEVVFKTTVKLINIDHQTIVIPNRENHFSLVVAADGINSLFRSLVHAKQTIATNPQMSCRENIQDLGRINCKAVVPVELSECINPDHFRNNTTYCYFPPQSGIACFAGPAGKGYTYWAVSMTTTTADSIVREPAQVESGQDQEIPSYFGWDNNIQMESAQEAIKERLLDLLTSKLNTPPEWDFIVPLITRTDASSLRMIRSEEVPINDCSLVSTDGCVVLVGDAAHAMSASYGQAASFALEDAVTLAVCLRNNPVDKVTSALNEYSQRRVSRCLEMQRQAADRAAKQLRGEPTEDISSWIYQWSIE
jgi:2-polyprenyl-6-methoxyphenol hydroxylase-like FAD-dependent oxidoreductase